MKGDARIILSKLLGSPMPGADSHRVLQARKRYEEKNFEGAMKSWPRTSGIERRVLARFIKTGSAGKAAKLIEGRLRRLWVSALQSRLFNDVVTRRMATLDKVLEGDMCYLHANGACFHVEDVAKEQPRCDAFEISPTGPLIGYRVSLPIAAAMEVEQAVFDQFNLKPADFKSPTGDHAKGARRPLRVQPTDVSIAGGTDDHGSFITVAFTLPAGAFATILMGELMKSSIEDIASDPESSENESSHHETSDDSQGHTTDARDPDEQHSRTSSGHPLGIDTSSGVDDDD